MLMNLSVPFALVVKMDQLLETLVTTLIFVFIGVVIFAITYGILGLIYGIYLAFTVVVSLSVHGPERAGIEGGARYVEDLARWATDEPGHILRNGTEEDSVGIPVSEVLGKVHLYVSNINPDGWAAGDAAPSGRGDPTPDRPSR